MSSFKAWNLIQCLNFYDFSKKTVVKVFIRGDLPSTFFITMNCIFIILEVKAEDLNASPHYSAESYDKTSFYLTWRFLEMFICHRKWVNCGKIVHCQDQIVLEVLSHKHILDDESHQMIITIIFKNRNYLWWWINNEFFYVAIDCQKSAHFMRIKKPATNKISIEFYDS
jgi:hypothetical protein